MDAIQCLLGRSGGWGEAFSVVSGLSVRDGEAPTIADGLNKKPEQPGWAQRACDEAKERGLSIVHLAHPATLFSGAVQAWLGRCLRFRRVIRR